MRRIAIATVLMLLSVECHAQMQTTPDQGQCEQVRSAIAQYGLQAARKHAMANYNLSAADLSNIERGCGIGGSAGGSRRAKK
jgi:hypothetical protein